MRALVSLAAAALSLSLLAACQTQQVDAAPPTVTFSHTDDDYDEVAMQADDYCERQYGLDARLIDRDRHRGGYEATFACD